MSDFKAKMHQIRFRLGLFPRRRWGSLQHSPRPLAGFKGAASRQGGEREIDGEKEGRGMGNEGRGGEERRERNGREEGGGKRTGGMGWTGEDMGWDGEGRER